MSYQLMQRTQVYNKPNKWRYTQRSAALCRDLARHVWRWFFTLDETNTDEMSPSSKRAWSVCRDIWPVLTPTEQDIVKVYHTANNIKAKEVLAQYAKQRGLSNDYCWGVIVKVWRAWAVERGISDE